MFLIVIAWSSELPSAPINKQKVHVEYPDIVDKSATFKPLAEHPVTVIVPFFTVTVFADNAVFNADKEVTPVPPLAIGNVPVTPGVTFLLPSNDAVLVLPRLVLIVLAVASLSAEVAEPPTVDEPA